MGNLKLKNNSNKNLKDIFSESHVCNSQNIFGYFFAHNTKCCMKITPENVKSVL